MPQRKLKGVARFLRKLERLEVEPVREYPEYFSYAKPSVNHDAIIGVLEGRTKDLFVAFEWACSHRSGMYWSVRCNGETPMSEEDYLYLYWLLEEFPDHAQRR